MNSSSADTEFSALQFEKTLTTLKDSQESINQCCQWCLANRQHYKKIVSSWLNVLKRVKVEQRLTLFYLANDVVQYSKRRNYEYIDTWGTAIQKATTMVRDEKVKHKILRIFKIWEQRGVYGEEFIADLCGLISIQPAGPKSDEPHEFQASYVINKIKNCAKLEKDTDKKLKVLKEHNPKIQISEGLINSLKGNDRAHVDDVEKEVDVYVEHMENYINALKLEIKNRIALISVLKQAETQLESDRKDVKMVAHAYKTFGQRVKVFQKKLEEHMGTLPSPIPSPDINAPSPSPEEDLELPEDETANNNSTENSVDLSAIQFTNPGYYVPPPTSNSVVANSTSYNNSYNTISSFNSSAMNNSTSVDTSVSFLSNGFSSFLGQNVSFDISNISATGLFSNAANESAAADNTQTTNSAVTTPTAAALPPIVDLTASDMDSPAPYNPLLPPPMPPFSKNNESGFSFNSSMDISTTSTYDPAAYHTSTYTEPAYSTDTGLASSIPDSHFDYQMHPNPYPASADDSYDPSQVTEAWEDIENPPWNDLKDTDTPESPPIFEKEGYGDPVEYHDSSVQSGAVDVDHRVIPGMGDLEDSLSSLGGKDVDHRNLISLTGSPGVELPVNGGRPAPLPARGNLKTITPQETLWDSLDQDYRNLPMAQPSPSENASLLSAARKDQDYRLQFNLDVPPPPPPPPKSPVRRKPPPPPPLPAPGTPGDPRMRYGNPNHRKGDILGDVDMDLSDDLEAPGDFLDEDTAHLSLEPPPPLPDLLDDVDANQFLDEISNDLNEFSNLSADLEVPEDENEPPQNGHNSDTQPMDENNGAADSNDGNANTWGPLQPPPMAFGIGSPSGMEFSPGIPPPPSGFVPGMNRMDMGNLPPGPPPPMMDGSPMAPFPTTPNWMSERPPPPWDSHGGGGFKSNRGGMNNFRGGFDNNNFNRGGGNFRGGFRGRGGGRGGGGSPWVDRGRGRGGNRIGRGGGSPFRPRGFFRGRGR